MTDKLQSVDAIGSMDNSQTAKPSDPLQAEYEEGKKYLENQEYGQAAVALHMLLLVSEKKKMMPELPMPATSSAMYVLPAVSMRMP